MSVCTIRVFDIKIIKTGTEDNNISTQTSPTLLHRLEHTNDTDSLEPD